MKEVYCCISIDVEPDCSPSWHYSNPLHFEGVRVGIAEILQPLFNKYGCKPTYLINNVVLEDVVSVKVFKELSGTFELGTHLHPEFIEPQKEIFNYAGSKGEANCCFYPPEIERGKLIEITELFRNAFGYSPTSFRAGRFSAGANTINVLKELNYLVDTSVTPLIKWADKTRETPVDFSECNMGAYFTDGKSFPKKAVEGSILEVPVTIIATKKVGIVSRVVSRLLGRQEVKPVLWLRPKFSTFDEMVQIIETAERQSDKIIVLNMMFHNVEVMPGLSPYNTSAVEAEAYLNLIEKFLNYCNKKGIVSVGLSDLYEKFRQ